MWFYANKYEQFEMKKKLQHLARYTKRQFNLNVLHRLDTQFSTPAVIEHPPVFIIGAPRCGSTLLSQLLVHSLDVGYFSNLHAQLYGSPTLANHLRILCPLRYRSDFESHHGVTKGLDAPSENAEYWYRFFRRKPAYVPLAEMPAAAGEAFRRSMMRFVAQAQRPVIIKNLYAVLRLEVLMHFLPTARFIVLRRNVFDNAVSLLAGRLKEFGTYERWWSVEPPNFESFQSEPPEIQVVKQIEAVHQLIDIAVNTSGCEGRFLHLNYEDLCESPRLILESVQNFIPDCQIRENAITQIPVRFARRQAEKDELPIYTRLNQYLQGLQFRT